MNKRFTIFMLLMAIFVPWAAKAQETKMIQIAHDRGGNRGIMTVYKRVTSLTSGRNYLIVSSATANSDALALSQTSSNDASITASYVHINAGISATNNAAYIANLADPTAVWKATSGWTFSHSKNGSNYYIYTSSTYTSAGSLSASTTATNWDWSNNQLSYTATLLGFLTSTYYITPSSTGFSIGSSAANVYLYEETSVTAYDVTAYVSPAGIGRVTGAGQYPSGATCTLTASTTNSEYAFSNWTVNGSMVSTSPTYSFTVSEDLEVVANFESTASCPSPSNLTAGTIYGHSVQLDWTSEADNFNVHYRTIGSSETQTFFDGFENGLGNWTVIRNGGGDNSSETDWAQNSPNFSSGNVSPHSGTYVAMSRSWNGSAYSVDNWLITPQVTLDGTLKFWVLDDGRYHEHYDVYVSTSGNSIADFNLYYEPGNASDTWTQVTVDLSSFNGASGYIALRHTDIDQDYLLIDDFGIYAQSYGEWSQLIPASESPFTLTGLDSQTAYQVEVQANCGNELSGWSNRVSFTTTAPSTAAPTNLTVDVNSITNNSATTSWQGVAANDSHQYYQVYYAESNVTSVPTSPAAPNLIDSITETTYTLTGLTPETEYHVWVRDYCGEDGHSPWTSYQTFTTLVSCPKPTNFISSNVTGHTATLSWNEIGTATNWVIEFGTASDFTGATSVNVSDTASIQLTGLNGETTYYARVKADCGDGDESIWVTTSFITDITCPAPTELTIIENSITSHTATVSWTDAIDSYQYYQLYYAESNITSVPDSIAVPNLIDSISESSYTLLGLNPETEYHVWVRVYCGEDGYSVWSSYQTFTTLVSCPAPTGLAVVENSIYGHGATISWDKVATEVIGPITFNYVCVASGDTLNWDNAAILIDDVDSPNPPSVNLTDLVPETEYAFYLRKDCDEEGYSREVMVSFTTEIACPAPTDLTVVEDSITSHTATVSWTNASYGYQYYQVYYAESIVTSVPDSLAAPNLIDSIPVTSYTLSGLNSETEYHVWVRAYCGDNDGYSDWTSYQTFTTLVSCPAPTGLAVIENSITGHDAIVSWDSIATQETGSVIFNYVCVANGDTLNWENTSIFIYDMDSLNPPTVNLTDLAPETEYTFYLRKDCDEEGYSREVMISFTTGVACPVPTDLIVVEDSITGHGATVSWTDNDGHQYYQLYYAESDVTSVPDSIAAPNLIDSISVTSYTLSGLHSETEYHVWVRAYCGDYDGYSVWTSYQTFTTLMSCFPPTDVTVSDETAHGATIEWNGTSDSYLVMVSASEQGTTYSYDFEDGTSQGWTTLQGPNSTSSHNWMHISEYSYAYNYETMSSGHGYNGSDGYMYSESYITGSSSGSGTAVTPDNYLVSPQIPLGGSITFHAGGQNVDYCEEKFSLMVSTTGNDAIDNFTTVQTWTFTPTASSGNEWQEFTVDLSAYSGMGYVAIHHFDCYDQWFLCIDDITIEGGPVPSTWMTYEAESSPFVLYDAANIHPESTYSVQVIGVCDDEESRPSSTTSFTTTIACPAPTGLAVVENSVTGHGASLTWAGTSDGYNVILGTYGPDSNVLNDDFSNGIPNNWNNTSAYPWSITDGYIKSGNAGVASSTSTISVTVTFPADGTMEFDAECMGEGTSTIWDKCIFSIDGQDQFTYGANNPGWNHYSYEVTAGQHTFTWSYTKDSSVNPDGDYFAIDNVVMISSSIVWDDPFYVEGSEYTLSGLTSETTYFVKVQSNCGDEGLSAESNSVTFTTLISCPAPTPLDPTDVTSNSAVLNWTGDAESYNVSYYKTFFFDSFEEGLSQWTIYKEGDEASWEWRIENPHDNSADLNAHSGNYAAVAYSDVDVHADSWLVSPQIQFPNQTTLRFWIMRSTYDDAQDEYEVRLSTTGNAIENFTTILQDKETANSDWTEVVIDLSEYDGQQGYIAIRHDFTGGFFLMVDDFGIYGWSEEITTTDNSLLIEDLLPETEYPWHVQANCGDEDGLSHWSEITTFTTLRACPIPFYLETYDETAYGATIAWTGYSDSYVVMVKENQDEEAHSYSYDFEDGSLQGWTLLQGNEGTSPNNWMHVSAYPTSANDISNDHGHNSSDGFMLSESYIYGETQAIGTAVTPDNYLVSPQVWLGGSITFYAGIQDVSFYAEKFSVMVSTTGNDDVSDFTTVQTWTFTPTVSSGSEWQEFTVDLSAFSGKGYIAIRHFNCSDQWLLCIDDITIESGPVIPTWFTYESEASPFVLYDPEHLSAETTYLVKVKGFCDGEATGFSDSITFTTMDESTKIFVFEGDWSDGDNWIPAGVPSIDEDVILRAEATVFDIAEANNITIDDAGTLTIEDGGQLKTNADVEATMKKFIIGYGTDYVETNDGYYLMALPTAAPISAADAGLITEESDYDLYSWNRTAIDEEWQNNHDSLSIENGQGYLYSNRDDMEMSFTATLRNSSEPITLTAEYDDVEHGGWNLYGNPFPCEAYLTTEAEGMTFYRLIGNELVPFTGAIAPLEAFFVKATAAGQTFTISREVPEER